MAYVKNEVAEVNPEEKFKNIDITQLNLFEKVKKFPVFSEQISGIVMADGLSSNSNEKWDGSQKIFDVCGNYILGTGMNLKISFVNEQLLEQFKGTEKVSPVKIRENIIKIVGKYASLKNGEILDFIVVGKEEDKLVNYRLILSEIQKPLLEGNIVLDGSGSEFVSKAFERDRQRGLVSEEKYKTIGDLALTLFDWGYVATKSSGVNDEFQFGFILPEGNATLFHPDVQLKFPTKEYVDKSGNFDQKKYEENSRFFIDFYKKLKEGRELQFWSNKYTSYLMSSGPERNEEVFENLSSLAKNSNKVRKELNQMIYEYVLKHNQKQ